MKSIVHIIMDLERRRSYAGTEDATEVRTLSAKGLVHPGYRQYDNSRHRATPSCMDRSDGPRGGIIQEDGQTVGCTHPDAHLRHICDYGIDVIQCRLAIF